jgi:hypothetical protein
MLKEKMRRIEGRMRPARRRRRTKALRMSDEAPVVDSTVVVEAMAVQAWRRSRSERAGGGEMIVVRVRV